MHYWTNEKCEVRCFVLRGQQRARSKMPPLHSRTHFLPSCHACPGVICPNHECVQCAAGGAAGPSPPPGTVNDANWQGQSARVEFERARCGLHPRTPHTSRVGNWKSIPLAHTSSYMHATSIIKTSYLLCQNKHLNYIAAAVAIKKSLTTMQIIKRDPSINLSQWRLYHAGLPRALVSIAISCLHLLISCLF